MNYQYYVSEVPAVRLNSKGQVSAPTALHARSPATLVDSAVILEVVTEDPAWSQWSELLSPKRAHSAIRVCRLAHPGRT
jgi:hypothetical protein